MEYLKNKLNRNIYNIVYDYLDQSKEHLIKIAKKIKYKHSFDTNIDILDMISRAIQLGYNGVYIQNIFPNLIQNKIRYIKEHNLNYISIEKKNDGVYFIIKDCAERTVDFRLTLNQHLKVKN